jgi:hypothetical protein
MLNLPIRWLPEQESIAYEPEQGHPTNRQSERKSSDRPIYRRHGQRGDPLGVNPTEKLSHKKDSLCGKVSEFSQGFEELHEGILATKFKGDSGPDGGDHDDCGGELSRYYQVQGRLSIFLQSKGADDPR